MTLAEQLTEIYLNEERHYEEEEKLSKEDAKIYYQSMLEKGNIIVYLFEGRVIGYVEFFLEHGTCFINDLFIRPIHRCSHVLWELKRRLFEVAKGAKIYHGERYKFGTRFPRVQIRRS